MPHNNQPLLIVLLSGPICAGKSTLSTKLQKRYGTRIVKTRELILQQRPRTRQERKSLQRAGEALDRIDDGAWVKNSLSRLVETEQKERLFVVDSVRIAGQIAAVRQAFGTSVYHIHLTAADEELARRYAARDSRTREFATYEEVRRSRTEKNIHTLEQLADVVVRTDRCTDDAVLVRAIALLGLYPRSTTRLVDVLVGGQYGSEGKGNIVGHIAPEYDLLIRVGGPNAGHKVFREEEPEVYHHLPSGTLRAPTAKLLLGAGALLYLPRLMAEIAQHGVSAERLSIDPQAMIIHQADRTLEKKVLASISSTAQGVGAATARKIMGRGGRSRPKVRLAKDELDLRPFIRDGQSVLEDAYTRQDRILLEGTQGTTLSIHHGEYPHVTSRDTTVAGCLADAGVASTRVRRVVMVCRTFPIRVQNPEGNAGTSGRMAMEIGYEDLSERSGIALTELLKIERTTTTDRQRRLGEFDWVQLHRSTVLNGPTDIALTFVDYFTIKNRSAYRYEQLTPETLRFVEEVERVSGVPVSLISTDFSRRNIIDRRSW